MAYLLDGCEGSAAAAAELVEEPQDHQEQQDTRHEHGAAEHKQI